VNILAISGSLRVSSSNSALIRAVAALAPPGINVHIYAGLGQLPFFNPDLDVEPAASSVEALRHEVRATEALLISSPEYAHGVPGVLKNALDWLVGSGELIDKPIAVINASPRATHAFASLTETLSVMSGRIVREASITVAVSGRLNDEHAIGADPLVAAALRDALTALAAVVQQPSTS
jgi:chromate reductase, NAD(P)H dehydrogenase (quinone)